MRSVTQGLLTFSPSYLGPKSSPESSISGSGEINMEITGKEGTIEDIPAAHVLS